VELVEDVVVVLEVVEVDDEVDVDEVEVVEVSVVVGLVLVELLVVVAVEVKQTFN
jgi:hypothetical protein